LLCKRIVVFQPVQRSPADRLMSFEEASSIVLEKRLVDPLGKEFLDV